MKAWMDQLSQEEQARLADSGPVDKVQVMLATLSKEPFSDPDWIFERKLDGERCVIIKDETRVRLRSRNHKDLNGQYPELVRAFQPQGAARFTVDGEIVAFDHSVTSFERLQKRMHVEDPSDDLLEAVPVFCYVFDLLQYDGYDLTDVPLRSRKKLLKQILQYEDPIRFVPHRNARGESLYKTACEKGWEGIIAKHAQSQYVHGRSEQWLKLKCRHQQEFVIAGYTQPHGDRVGFGALLMGYYEGKELHYAGKVGTGYDDRTLERLHRRFQSLQTDSSPYAENQEVPDKEVQWLEPKLVAEVAFEEWTQHGKLRQPSFLGMRQDKDPDAVSREHTK